MLRSGFVRITLVALALAVSSCSDNGPSLPLLFVQSGGGNGNGTVTSAPSGINCTISGSSIGGTCSANFDAGTGVTLTAIPAAGTGFTTWNGGCTGSSPTCSFALDASADVTAQFDLLVPQALTVTSGNGGASGVVTSTPGGISCTINGGAASGDCTADFAGGSTVTLTAAGTGASAFNGWGGACAAGTGPSCLLVMTQARSASAIFSPSTSFVSFVAVASSENPATGILVVSIPTSVFLKANARLGTNASSASRADVPATGSLEIFQGGGTVDLSGTYDDVQKLFTVEGGGWTFNGSVDGQSGAVDGGFGGPLGGGVLSGSAGGTSAARTLFCGTYDGTDSGSWHFVLQGNSAEGVTNNATGGVGILSGALDGSEIFFDASIGPASGTIAADGQSASGSWGTVGGPGGNWEVTTDCQ
jgi:hypothetical protein